MIRCIHINQQSPLGNNEAAGHPLNIKDVKDQLDSLEKKLYSVNREVCDAQWDLYTSGDSERWPEAIAKRACLYGNEYQLSKLRELCPDSPQDKWRVERLINEFVRESVRVDTDIVRQVDATTLAISNQRAQLNGSSVTGTQIDEILRQSTDRSQRETAWHSKAVMGGKHIESIVNLCKHRNKNARHLGFPTFHDLVLETQWLDREQLLKVVNDLKQLTDPLWHSFLQKQANSLSLKELQLWDLQFNDAPINHPTFAAKNIVPMAAKAVEKMGLPLSETGIFLDTEIRDKKSEHAYCFPVDPPNDIRILANVCNGIQSLHTLLHEIGHALHAAHIQPSIYTFRDAPNHAFSEAVAQLIASIAWQPEFLVDIAKLMPGEVETHTQQCATRQLAQVRWLLVWHELELGLFHEPDRDPNALFWQLVESHIGVNANATTRKLSPWGNVIHFVTHPVYLQNYLWAEVMAAQMSKSISERYGSLLSKPSGRYIKDRILSPGASIRFDTLLDNISNEALNLMPLISFLEKSRLA